jgi:hypothetical protein
MAFFSEDVAFDLEFDEEYESEELFRNDDNVSQA